MKILQVMAGAESGGAETAFIDMVLAMQAQGANQHVVTRANHRNQRLTDAGIPVTTLPFRGMIDIYTPWRLKKIIRAFEPQIVQTWMSRAGVKTPPWHGQGPRYLKICRLGGYYKLKYFKGADYFITITPDIRRYLTDLGIAPDRVRHINNFADLDPPQQPINRADYQTPAEAPLLVTLGRLHTAKAFDTLLKAMIHLPGVYLWIGGSGPERDKLEQLAEKLNINDRVRFLGWVNDRAALLQAGDVCVFPSRYEPFGTVFVQAWAAGIPLVTSDADGPRQYVRDGEDALVFAVDDEQACAAQIWRLIRDPALCMRLKASGTIRYQKEFTREKTVTAYLDFYREALARANL